MLIEIVVYPGVDELDVFGPLEVLRSAADMGGRLRVRTVARASGESGPPEVTGAHGVRFLPDAAFEPGAAGVLLVPGGGWVDRAENSAWGEVQRGDLLPLLAAASASAAITASVCTGAMLLAHAGVLEGRRAATHASARADLAALGVTVVDQRVVDDGDLVTCGGVTSGIDLALWLLEREMSPELAAAVARRLEYTPACPG